MFISQCLHHFNLDITIILHTQVDCLLIGKRKQSKSSSSSLKKYIVSNTYKSNALTNPGTVMIKSLNTIVADRTMRGTRRPVQQTCITVLDFNCVSIHDYILCSWKFQMRSSTVDPLHGRGMFIKCFVRFRRCCVSWDNSRISTRCQKEKNYILHEILKNL